MSSESAIRLDNLGKCYHIYEKPRDRLLQMLLRGRRRYYREFWALKGVNLRVMPGEVVGIIGKNGAGKSTLLQMVCGTLNPTVGNVAINGRVAALLELGAGFNPEFSGRENVFLSAALAGLSQKEIAARFEDIVEFSGIRDFIDQPVKTYSSGMYVRLAFSVAINVDPDILVIDEALSVGDGDFSRRSFDRIMALKNLGKTILFCSHSMYQVDAICNRAIWLADGEVQLIGSPGKVIEAYIDFLSITAPDAQAVENRAVPPSSIGSGIASITAVTFSVDGRENPPFEVQSGMNDVSVRIQFTSDPSLPIPSVGICFVGKDGRGITSAGTHVDNALPRRESDGSGEITVVFPKFALLRGVYRLDVYLFCELGIHVYDSAIMAAEVSVSQATVEVGVVTLPHTWIA